MSNEINASLQNLLRRNNIYFILRTKTNSEKGHNFAKILRLITNIERPIFYNDISFCKLPVKSLHPCKSYRHETNINTTTKNTLRKQAYSNILKISPPKTENFSIKNSDMFHISAQKLEAVLTSTHNLCFWAEIRKIIHTPVNPSLTI